MSVRNLGIDLLKKMSGSSCGTSGNWKLGWQGKEWKYKAMPQIFSFYFTSRLCNGCVSMVVYSSTYAYPLYSTSDLRQIRYTTHPTY